VNLLIAFVALFFLALILEIVFRLPQIVQKTGGNQPEFKKWQDYVSSHEFNSLGFRDREHSLDKPKGTYRILVLGDSIVYGQMVDYDKIFSVVLEQRLSQLGRLPVEVISMGHMGWNTAEQLQAFAEKGVKFDPDLVIVGFVLNDPQIKDNPVGDELQDPERPILPFLTVDKWLNQKSKLYSFVRFRYNRFLEKAGRKGDYTVWQRNLYQPDARNFKAFTAALAQIKELAMKQGSPVLLVSLNFYPNWEKESALVFQTAQGLGIPVLDPLPLFANFTLPELQVSPSDGHPNAKAHAIFAQAITDDILENIW